MGNQKYLLQRQADTKGQPTGRDKIKILAQSSDFFFLFPPYSGQNTTHEKQKIRTRTWARTGNETTNELFEKTFLKSAKMGRVSSFPKWKIGILGYCIKRDGQI